MTKKNDHDNEIVFIKLPKQFEDLTKKQASIASFFVDTLDVKQTARLSGCTERYIRACLQNQKVKSFMSYLRDEVTAMVKFSPGSAIKTLVEKFQDPDTPASAIPGISKELRAWQGIGNQNIDNNIQFVFPERLLKFMKDPEDK